MSKKAVTINRLQNLAIVLLSLSAAFLLIQTPLFGDLTGRMRAELSGSVFPSEQSSSVHAELSDFAFPVRIICTNDYARRCIDSLTILEEDFNQAATFLSKAFDSASPMIPSAEESFLAAMHGSGIYYDFTTALPLEILSDALRTSAPTSQDFSVRRALICPVENTASLYLLGQDGTCYSFSTALRSSELSAYLESTDGTDVNFAFSFPEEYSMLSPFTLITSEPASHYTLAAASSLSEIGLSDFLRLAEFNPHTENRYTESTGTTVIRESYGTLRLSPDGTVTYRSGGADAGSLYAVAPDQEVVSARDAVSAAENLVSVLLQDSGAASLYLSGVDASAGGYLVTLDYMVDGTPLCFSDGSHAVCVNIDGHSISDFTIHFRNYTLTDTASLLLPMQQAAAIAQSRYEGSELSVFYIDNGSDTVCVDWIAN